MSLLIKGVTKHSELPDVSTPHVLADLESAVCSETEADGKITTHKGDASAHHTKYTDAEAVTAMGAKADDNPLHHNRTTPYTHPDPPACRAATSAQTGHATATQISKLDGIEAQANKYVHPTTGTCPQNPKSHSHLTVAETEVFNGTSPTVWTDLDLSGTIGSNAALVLLKITGIIGKSKAFRKNGDTDEFYLASVPDNSGLGCAMATGGEGVGTVVLVATDASGVIEWITETAQTYAIDIIAYIK